MKRDLMLVALLILALGLLAACGGGGGEDSPDFVGPPQVTTPHVDCSRPGACA